MKLLNLKTVLMAAIVMASGVSEARLMSHSPRVERAPVQMKVGENYQVLEFAQGSKELSDSSASQLRTLIDTAKANGKIENLYVAAWSDEHYPTGKTKLSKTERKLAKDRLASVDKFVKNELNIKHVTNFNMAEHSNWFARLFRTKDAEVKSLYTAPGAPKDVLPEQFLTLKEKGGPDRAVVVLRVKGSNPMAQAVLVPSSEVVETHNSARTTRSTSSASTTAVGGDIAADNSIRRDLGVRGLHQNRNSERVFDYNNDSNAREMRATGDVSFDDNYNGPQSPSVSR